MASTASDSPPSSPAVQASAFLDDRTVFLDPATCSFFPATTSREEEAPPPAALASSSSAAAAARKPPRKRPRASRRPPTTVLTTDTSNFRAMVQEFTGIPAPPPFAPHHLLGPGGVLFGGGGPHGHDPAARAPFDLLMRPSPLKLPVAAPTTTAPPTGSFAHSLFANSSSAGPSGHGSSSELYGGGFAPATLSGAATVPGYDGSFEPTEDESVGHGHGLFSSLLHAGDRYHSH